MSTRLLHAAKGAPPRRTGSPARADPSAARNRMPRADVAPRRVRANVVPRRVRAGAVLRRVREGRRGLAARPWWPWLRRLLVAAFFATLALLLVRYAATVDWPQVGTAIRAYPWPTLLAAGVLAAASHTLYSSFDLLGRRYTGHALSTFAVMKTTFISYAFNLNLGSLIGGIAFRYRLYSVQGIAASQVTRILTLSMLTNWLGYLVLAGIAFTFWPPDLPPAWRLDRDHVSGVGMTMLAAAAAWLAACALATHRHLRVRGHELHLPSLRMALLQVAMSCANWSLIASVVYVLMPDAVAFGDVLSVLLIAAVAGVITHVPAGLGVLEAVFVALLSHQASVGQLLAALLTYRAIYYIAPFLIASAVYLFTEARRAERARP